MAHAQLARAVHTMRRRGVRRENVRLNTELTPSLANTDLGLHPCAYNIQSAPLNASQVRLNTERRLYAFNWVQQQALPEGYSPPEGSASGGKG